MVDLPGGELLVSVEEVLALAPAGGEDPVEGRTVSVLEGGPLASQLEGGETCVPEDGLRVLAGVGDGGTFRDLGICDRLQEGVGRGVGGDGAGGDDGTLGLLGPGGGLGEGAVGAEDAELVVDAIVASGVYDM